jgi:hypothetical protein
MNSRVVDGGRLAQCFPLLLMELESTAHGNRYQATDLLDSNFYGFCSSSSLSPSSYQQSVNF